ncbi:hypothetical protein [Neptuniibacter marinus]|uniref:hypothetical protein n=1 Tax=Neptuniibacter marinus TaxID=1806670 RepID=UPI003B5B00B0
MGKLKRKLSLLNIPVYDIKDEGEIYNVLLSHLELTGEVGDKLNLCFAEKGTSSFSFDRNLSFVVFKMLLAVEESSILFVDKRVNDNIKSIDMPHYTVLIIQERDVVDNIELALHRIASGSGYSNEYIEIIYPNSISSNSIVLIVKD